MRSHFFPIESIAGRKYFCFPPDIRCASAFPHVTNNPVYLFFCTPKNFGPFILRMILSGFYFFHGAQRALGWFGGAGWHGTIEEWTASTGPAWPLILIVFFLVGELLLSFSLFLGFFTRLAGAAVTGIMFFKFAILSQQAQGLAAYELPIMIWAVGLSLLCLGGGALSTDRAISENLLPVVG